MKTTETCAECGKVFPVGPQQQMKVFCRDRCGKAKNNREKAKRETEKALKI